MYKFLARRFLRSLIRSAEKLARVQKPRDFRCPHCQQLIDKKPKQPLKVRFY